MRTLLAVVGWGVVVAGSWLTAALAADEDAAPKGDLGKLQGKWTAKVGPEKSIPLVMAIKKDKVTITMTRPGGEDLTLTGRVKVREDKVPKELDWYEFDRPDGQPAEENLAIYELDGDHWKVCAGGPGNERPEKFEQAADGGHPRIVEFERVPEEAKDGAARGDLAGLQGVWVSEHVENDKLCEMTILRFRGEWLTCTWFGVARRRACGAVAGSSSTNLQSRNPSTATDLSSLTTSSRTPWSGSMNWWEKFCELTLAWPPPCVGQVRPDRPPVFIPFADRTTRT